MKRHYNAFYANCIHFRWRYPRSVYIGNSHSRVIAYCKLYRCNAFDFKLDGGFPICCVSQSPYASQNCRFFKDKSNQTQLSAFGV